MLTRRLAAIDGLRIDAENDSLWSNDPDRSGPKAERRTKGDQQDADYDTLTAHGWYSIFRLHGVAAEVRHVQK